ncbi:UDP-glucuronic acid decarboxylase 1, partial [Lophium mytilinum]
RMKILVTGATGFLGTRLVEFLLNLHHEVIVLDSFWTGPESSLELFKTRTDCKPHKHDVIDPFPDIQVDQIYHLACSASPKRFTEDPLKILRTCFEGTRNALDLAQRLRARILIASTSGKPNMTFPRPQTYWGNVSPYGPRACYDEGKRAAEALAYAYQKQHSTEVRIARIFNTYGPGMRPDDGRVIPNFIVAAFGESHMRVTGDSMKLTRSFQYVTDCVTSLVRLMGSNVRTPVNIGNDEETRIWDLAHIVAGKVARTGRPMVAIEEAEAPPDDPVQIRPDLTFARTKLGVENTVSLDEGLELTVEWFRSHLTDPEGQLAC